MRAIKRLLGLQKFEDPVLPGNYPYLVTGCARSGTHFMTAYLALNGVQVGHEKTESEGTVHWLCASPEYCRDRGAVFVKKAHIVRQPRLVMASLQTIKPRAWNFIRQYAPQCVDKDKVIAAAKYWLYWNRMAAENAAFTFRLEDFDEKPQDVCETLSGFFGRDILPSLIAAAKEKRDSRTGARNYGTGDALQHVREKNPQLYAEVTEAAEQWGYNTSAL